MNLSKTGIWTLCSVMGLVLTGCGKKAPPAPAPAANTAPGAPARATPRKYIVNGRIDLEALTQTVREYARWKGQIPTDFNDLVRSGFLTNAPTPPKGKAFAIVRYGIGYGVVLADP